MLEMANSSKPKSNLDYSAHSEILIRNLQQQLSEVKDLYELELRRSTEMKRLNNSIKHKMMRTYQLMYEKRSDHTNARNIRLIKLSGLFDEIWYIKKYLNGDMSIDPILHYLRIGAKEGKNPSVKFNTVYYILQNPVVIEKRLNPLVHYEQVGRSRGFLTIEPVVY